MKAWIEIISELFKTLNKLYIKPFTKRIFKFTKILSNNLYNKTNTASKNTKSKFYCKNCNMNMHGYCQLYGLDISKAISICEKNNEIEDVKGNNKLNKFSR